MQFAGNVLRSVYKVASIVSVPICVVTYLSAMMLHIMACIGVALSPGLDRYVYRAAYTIRIR